MQEQTTQPIKLYRPSNGTDFHSFMAGLCDHCARHAHPASVDIAKEQSDLIEPCDILNRATAFAIDHAQYPSEWTYADNKQPVCLAFVHTGDVIPERCEHTLDLFAQPTEQAAQS